MTSSRLPVTVLDGGFATQLSVHVGKHVDGDPLWSARFNATNPNAVYKTHLDFLEAGAQCIMTNTYQASIEGYGEYLDLSEAASIQLIKSTVKLAHMARTKHLAESDIREIPLVVASIGPYGAHLHDGSEYTGEYADYVSADTIQKWHRSRIDACLETGVDVLGIETIPCKVTIPVIPVRECWSKPLTLFPPDGSRRHAGDDDRGLPARKVLDLVPVQGQCPPCTRGELRRNGLVHLEQG